MVGHYVIMRNGKYLTNISNFTSCYKYIGLLCTPTLSWLAAKTKLALQARKAMYAVRNYQIQFGFLPLTFVFVHVFRLFDSMVVPILLFDSEVCGYEYSEAIERVHVEYCRYFS